MSVRVMTWVWDMDLPATEKLVMLALADCANDEGTCWPSIATLGRKTGSSERTIQRAIQASVERGLLRRVEVPGKGCRYHFDPRQNVTPVTVAPVTERRQPPSECHPTPVTVTPKPSMNHQEPSSSDASHPQDTGVPAKPDRKKPVKAKLVLPDWMPVEAFEGYLEMRRRIGKPATDRAIELMIGKLSRWRDAGHDPGLILDNATEHNWTGLYEPKEPRNASNWNNAGPGNVRSLGKPKDGAIAALDRRLGLDGGPGAHRADDAGGSEGDRPVALAGPRRLFG